MFKKHDAITGHGHRIIELFHGVEDVLCRTILLLLAFLRSSELAAFICDKVETTPVDKYDLKNVLVGNYTKPLHPFVLLHLYT